MSDEIVSAIGGMKDGEYHLRDIPISRLMVEQDVISVMWLAWIGRVPTPAEHKLLNACFIASVDHGAAPPSAHVARRVASCGKPLADAVAAGLLTLGPRHGNAASGASQWVREAIAAGTSPETVAAQTLEQKKRLSGIGHPEYTIDPRTTTLATLAKQVLSDTPHLDFALEVARLMTEKKQTPLPLNVDGAIGALMADLHAPAELADAIFLCARTIGLVAQAREEAEGSKSYRR